MRKTLFVLLCSTISLSASAQWWPIHFKKHRRFPQLAQVTNSSVTGLPPATIAPTQIAMATIVQSNDHLLEAAEAAMIKKVQHNMQFGIYHAASYNFSDLAQLYVLQNRFSEAKWYFLQSNFISRQLNDDKHTIANLMALAMVKASIGDIDLAQKDLAEARRMACVKKWNDDVAEIDKEIKYIRQNISPGTRMPLRYADDAQVVDKKSN